MSESKDKISQQNPQTGAQPSQQTAENAKKSSQQGRMWRIDDLLYKLVENMVSYAGDQFGENLRFNSEVLCDLLFANIKDVIESKLDDETFSKWIADELLKHGAVVAQSTQDSETQTQTESGKEQEAKQEVVNIVSPEDYQDLVDKVSRAIALLQTQRADILKQIQSLDDSARSMSEESQVRLASDEQLRERRDKEITELIGRIQKNQETIDEYVQKRASQKSQLAKKISGLHGSVDAQAKKFAKQQGGSKIVAATNTVVKRISWSSVLPSYKAPSSKEEESEGNASASKLGKSLVGFSELSKNRKSEPKSQLQVKPKPLLKSKTKSKPKSKLKSRLFAKRKKTTLVQRIKRRIGVVKWKAKKRISNSFLGKTYRKISKIVKNIVGITKKIYQAVKKTIKAAWKVTKATVKAFVKISMVVGKAVVGAGLAIGRGIKHASKLHKMGQLGSSIRNFAPAQILTKLGWKAIKYVGKQIWKGIKALALKAIGLFMGLFGVMGKFVNKVGTWLGILGHGIKDKAYRFIVKPISNMMVSVFNFTTAVVTTPIKFIKWLVPAILNRINQLLSNIKAAIKSLVDRTKTLLGKILKNPFTWVVIIGGLFFLFRKWIFNWLQGEHKTLKEGVLSKLKTLSGTVLGFLKKLWMVVSTVGKFLFNAIEWLTNPKGWIAITINAVVTTFLAVKKWITEMVKESGQSSVDALCMFIAGDYIGMALALVKTYAKKGWDLLKNTKLFRWVRAIVKSLVGFGKLIFNASTVVIRSLGAGFKKVLTGDFGGVAKAIVKPWTDLWAQVKEVLGGKMVDTSTLGNEAISYDPTEVIGNTATESKIAVRSLGMKGTQEKNLEYWERFQAMKGQAAKGPLLPRIRKMNDIIQMNAQQVAQYQELLESAWQLGKSGPDAAQEIMRQMLESPELSQKLLSAFFYVNPQTGKTMMLRPASYIGQFLDNIREMVSDPNRDNEKAFKTLVEAFDQVNKERAHIVNNQGKVLADFAEKLTKFNVDVQDMEKNNTVQIRDYIMALNKGDLFSAATAQQSFKQTMDGQSKTEDVTSVTGDTLGNNDLLKGKPIRDAQGGTVALKDSDFELPPPPNPESEESRSKVGNVVLPPGSNPPPPKDPTEDMDMRALFEKYHDERRTILRQGKSQDQADEMGYKNYDFDEFVQNYKKLHPKSKEQQEAEEENTLKRTAALRNAKMISAYHSQGKEASEEGFTYKGTPSILQIAAEGLSKTLYMFSPEWQMMNNAVELNEDEIMLEVDKDNKAAQERMRKAREEKERKKQEEEKQRKREQEILDYSAKITNDGFIEVKIGEDETTMREAWYAHQDKRREFLRHGHSQDEADKVGLIDYDWEEWKRYYRKMHGLPEDGIKRIPLGVERKQRKIDWSARYPMSVDELAQYGIEMSEGGPVMIPLDKAMKAAGSLLQGAKTIYAVRDGLEVMRQGLATETSKLKERNKNGMPVAVAVAGGDSGGEQTTPVPDANSGYADVG